MSNTDDIAIKVSGVSKSFKLPHEKNTSVKSFVVNPFRKRTFEQQEVLKDINLEIKEGEFFGIVGRNGSGKSTLLKLLAGIYSPNKGHIQINGKLTPFIELGVGFNPELTGRENVYLNGALLGFNRKEMTALYDEIVEFAELERFMDQKLKNYSSGMQVRLAFSIAIRAQSEILLLDEVLAVGDEAFQRKCINYFGKLKQNKRTVILVSHSMDTIRNFCDRTALIEKGVISMIGKSSKVASEYSKLNASSSDADSKELTRWGNGSAEIKKLYTVVNGSKNYKIERGASLELVMEIQANENLKDVVIGLVISNSNGQTMFATNTLELEKNNINLYKSKKYTAKFSINKNILTNGMYSLSGAVANKNRTVVYSRVENAGQFTVHGWSMEHSMVHIEHGFELN